MSTRLLRRRAERLRRLGITETTRKRTSPVRRGAAAVEAAICIPIIIVMMMGTLEVCAGIYLKESISICCFEGCRLGTRRRATREMVQARVEEVLAQRGVTLPENGEGDAVGILIEPADFSGLRALDQISVQITAPTAGNSLFIFDNLLNRNVVSKVTMVREFNE